MAQGTTYYIVYSVNDLHGKVHYETDSLADADDWVGLDTDAWEVHRVGADGETSNVTFYEDEDADQYGQLYD